MWVTIKRSRVRFFPYIYKVVSAYLLPGGGGGAATFVFGLLFSIAACDCFGSLHAALPDRRSGKLFRMMKKKLLA